MKKMEEKPGIPEMETPGSESSEGKKRNKIIESVLGGDLKSDHLEATPSAADASFSLRKELEEYKKITANINEFLWSVSCTKQNEEVFYTDSVKKITGYTPDEIKAMPGRGLSLIHAEDAYSVRKQLSDFENDPAHKTITLIYRIVNKSGDTLWVKENITVERTAPGAVVRYDGIVSDITELKNIELALKESREKLVELNAAKDRFISIVSHDLRAPFTSILGFAEILLNEPDISENEKNEYLSYIYESSQAQLQLVNYLLDWSRLQTGRVKLEPQRLKAQSLVYNCVSALTGNAVRKNIDIRLNVPETIFIQADEKLITQAVTNLISNAIKFTDQGRGVDIVVNSFKKGWIEFVVKDEGVGIAEENKSKIFKFDQKFTSEGTRGEKGSGLGLTLVKEIVEKHGGDIWFYSETGKGSEFHFLIPEAPNIVMLVEDDPSSRLLWDKIISKTLPNFEIIQANNGYEAMSVILNRIPTLVVTDHDMPLMNGIQLIEAMRKRDESNKVPVIVIAAMVTEELKEKYMKLGVEAVLSKPVDVKTFVGTLHGIIC